MAVISPTIKFNPQSNRLVTIAAGYVFLHAAKILKPNHY